jgi:hypothetical protein
MTSRSSPRRFRDASVTRSGVHRSEGVIRTRRRSKASATLRSSRSSKDWQGNTYRAVYTVRFEDAVYVLHVFQKKSLRGAETPKADIDRIKKRLREAKAIHKALRRKESNGG